jgi:hypothetical protein
MNLNGKLYLATFLGLGALLAACGDDTSGTGGGAQGGGGSGGDTTTTTSTTSNGGAGGDGGSGGSGGGVPVVPELGAQIDRMGRPAINTATIDTFVYINNGTLTPGDNTVRGASQDAYNADGNESAWGTTYGDKIALQLGVLDSLDTNCTNQLLSCGNVAQGEDCYADLAGILADDRLWVRIDGTDCSATAGIYLAVEANAVGIANADCGGRRPIDDVIQTSYSVLATGTLDAVDDEITAPAGLHPDAFPYMATPHIN